jgi:hypothetical protein
VKVKISSYAALECALGEGNDPRVFWCDGEIDCEIADAAVNAPRDRRGMLTLELGPEAVERLREEFLDRANALSDQISLRGRRRAPGEASLNRAAMLALYRDERRLAARLEAWRKAQALGEWGDRAGA